MTDDLAAFAWDVADTPCNASIYWTVAHPLWRIRCATLDDLKGMMEVTTRKEKAALFGRGNVILIERVAKGVRTRVVAAWIERGRIRYSKPAALCDPSPLTDL